MYHAVVTDIQDGDTYDVEVDVGFRMKAVMPLRLAHADTPVKGTEAGKRATGEVVALFGPLPCSVVVRTFKPVEKYGRYLADVYVGEVDVAQHLIGLGLAKPYEGGKKS